MSIDPRIVPSPNDIDAPNGATPADPDGAWRDRLVELHVLAEHGDEAAAAEARAWTDSDERAHRAWHEIESACRQVRRP
ncbi:hypothetical protein EV383_5617 [Pseudonocardia sediminis]|uniref:DUF4880 domain-containing protein n=1 Tax=Pseudonocardia sediminis TaxID=1397368 RepID=A0A4Q7V796_PSEST|nr:hypothetical protein [Pseudonocardia sediminis]RZT88673.1 hypothetical protein EV383_5617 [Pseudonocardia sediminis]